MITIENKNNFKIPNLLNGINLNDVSKNIESIQNYKPYSSINPIAREIQKTTKQMQEIGESITKKKEQQELRELRNLEINEEKLELAKLTTFLLQSVNRDQKDLLEKLQSLIETISFNDKVKESNIAIIQQELLELKQSSCNLNESFIKLIEKKMVEMGVEAAIKYFFVGMKLLFLTS